MNSHPRLIVLTGDGKGKTSSAAGMLLRAVGHGHAAFLVRFLKARPSGEVDVLRGLGVHVAGGGRGFLPRNDASQAFARHVDAAKDAWDDVERILASCEASSVVVLDELCVALAKDVLDHESVRKLLSKRRPGVSVVCTGRGAPGWLLDMADTVSEVVCRKHAFQNGVPATNGVEL